MFPIRDHNPSGRTPYVVYTLMAINIVIFLFSLDMRGDERALWNYYTQWALFPVRITDGDGFYTLVTSTFLHGGLMHLAGNMLFLWIFGDNMEDQMGHGGFLLFYMVCGVGASILQVMSNPDSAIPVVGASGAIAGVMGGYLLLFPKARIDILLILIIFFRIFTIPAWIMLGVWMGMQVFGGIGSDPDTGGVAYWAHGGGFIVGLVLTIPIWLSLGGTAFWHQTEGHPDHAPSAPPRGIKPWGNSANWSGRRGHVGYHPPISTLRPQPARDDQAGREDIGWKPEKPPRAKPRPLPPQATVWDRTDARPSVPSTRGTVAPEPTPPPPGHIPRVPRKKITRRGSPWQKNRK